MNSRFRTRWTISLVVVLLAVAVYAPAVRAADVRFQLVRDALIVIPVSANDSRPLNFLLDTGADTTIVDTAVARRLGLEAVRSVKQTTVTGKRSVPVSLLEKLAVGDARVDGLPVLTEDLSGLGQAALKVDGILGQDFLSRFNYMLDYGHLTLRIERGDEILSALNGESVPLELAGRRMIVAAQAGAGGSSKVRLMLDSGANSTVLMGAASNTVRCAVARLGTVMSLVGASVTRTGRLDELKVASHELRDLPVTLIEEVPTEGVGDGLLPTALFQTLYVNNARGFVMFNPKVRKLVLVARAEGE